MNKIIKQLGFKDMKEFNALVANVDLSNLDKVKKFKNWQKNDGSKKGLLELEKL